MEISRYVFAVMRYNFKHYSYSCLVFVSSIKGLIKLV